MRYIIILFFVLLISTSASKSQQLFITQDTLYISIDTSKLIKNYNYFINSRIEEEHEVDSSVSSIWYDDYQLKRKILYLAMDDDNIKSEADSYLRQIETEKLISPGGLLYEREITGEIEKGKIDELNEKRKKEITLEVTSGEIPALLCETDTPLVITNEKFDSLTSSQNYISYIENNMVEYIYPNPAFQYINDSLLASQIGIEKCYLLPFGRIIKYKIISIKDRDSGTENLEELLENSYMSSRIQEFISNLYCSSNFKINAPGCKKFYEVYKNNKSRNIGKLNENEFEKIFDVELGSYDLAEQRIVITVDDYVKKYNQEAIKREVAAYEDVITFLKDIVFDELAYQKAAALGLNSEPGFVNEIERIRDRLYIDYYLHSVLSERINISREEIEEYYLSNIREFYKPDSAALVFHYYNSLDSALETYHKNDLKNKNELTDIACVNRIRTVVSLNNSKEYGSKQLKKLRNLEEHSYSMPIFIEGIKYAIVYKEKNLSNQYLDLSVVDETIKKKILKDVMPNYKKELMKEINRKIQIKNRKEGESIINGMM